MRATDYLEKNKDNIKHYNEVKQVIDDTKEHRDNFGKIFEYCNKNLATVQKIKSELLPILKNEETYCVFFHLLNSDVERENTASTPYLVDESNVIERYYANLVREQENDSLYTDKWWRELEKQAERAIKFNRYDLIETLTKIDNYKEKLSYLINRQTDYLNERHKWKDLPEYDYSDLCENEINRLRQLQEIDNFSHKNTQKQTENFLPDNLLKSLQAKDFIENADIFPINWKGTLKELNYFINKYFPNKPSKWEKTVNIFVWNNTKINKKSLSTAIDKHDNEPERKHIIDNLLK